MSTPETSKTNRSTKPSLRVASSIRVGGPPMALSLAPVVPATVIGYPTIVYTNVVGGKSAQDGWSAQT